jgi:hypothetical protein
VGLSEDVDTHPVLIYWGREACGDDDLPALQIHLPHAGLDERQSAPESALEHVMQGNEHLLHPPEHPAALFFDQKPDE